MVNTVVVEKPQLLSAEDRLSQSGLSAQVRFFRFFFF